MSQRSNGMVRERLINCDTHFDNDQVEAVMQVVEDSGYSDMYEALKEADGVICELCKQLNPQHKNCFICADRESRLIALEKAEEA